jgi:hypothetical protein
MPENLPGLCVNPLGIRCSPCPNSQIFLKISLNAVYFLKIKCTENIAKEYKSNFLCLSWNSFGECLWQDVFLKISFPDTHSHFQFILLTGKSWSDWTTTMMIERSLVYKRHLKMEYTIRFGIFVTNFKKNFQTLTVQRRYLVLYWKLQALYYFTCLESVEKMESLERDTGGTWAHTYWHLLWLSPKQEMMCKHEELYFRRTHFTFLPLLVLMM